MITEDDQKRIAQSIEATGNGWVHPIDEEAGLRFDEYNRKWCVKLLGRDDPNAWIWDGLDHALSWCVKAIREDRLAAFLRRVDAPRAAILELLHDADLFCRAVEAE